MLKSTDSIRFWRDEDIIDLNCPINFIVPSGANLQGDWPGKIPSLTEIFKELSLSRVSYLRLNKNIDGKIFIRILVGRLIVNGHVVEKVDGKKIFLNKKRAIEYASNKSRGELIATGKRVKHDGINCAENFRDEARYTYKILDAKNIEIFCEDEPEDVEEKDLHYEEINLLDTLDQYIESEYELEQQVAQATPPFAYFNLKAETRSIVYRQFFRIDVSPEDLFRMRELKVTLVSIEDSGDPALVAEIVDLNPAQDKNEIIISLEKQVRANTIPKNGLLRLCAIPTLKNVRKAVVDQFRQKKCTNPWLLPVAAGTYDYRPLKSGHIPISPRENPPNPSQIDALNRGAGADDFLLVLGPPGTGKTTVILDWVRHFARQGKRVLITSQSNMAVDNVLERLVKEDDLECVRLGNETKVSSEMRKILIDNAATDIQNKLIKGLEDTQDRLSKTINDLQVFKKNLPKAAALKSEFERLESIKTDLNIELEAVEINLKKISADLDGQGDKLEKIELSHRKREEIFKRRSQARGAFGFISRFMSRFDATKLTQLDANISEITQLIDQFKQQKFQTEQEIKVKQDELEKGASRILYIEQQFPRLLELPEPLIPELDFAFGKSIGGFSELDLRQEVSDFLNRYQKIQTIVNEWQENFSKQRQKSLYQLLLLMVDVVGATCIGINTNKVFKDIPFDVVIVDESGQIQLHNLIVPLSRGPKAILVGDHKQLPPVVQDELEVELQEREVDVSLLKKSWFEILWESAPNDRRAMMDTQFRCPSSISDFVSKAFYDGKYKAGPTTGPDHKKPIFSFFEKPMVFIDTSGVPEGKRREKSSFQDGRNVVEGNPYESRLVVAVLEKAIAEMPELAMCKEIGIIVPYANHVKEIQREIRRSKNEMLRNLNIPLNELVASVDSFQGQERDLIIMAFTRSNKIGKVGFLRDWRRLNVAMTRTKKQLVLIGDLSTLKTVEKKQCGDEYYSNFKKAMSDLEAYIKTHGQYLDAMTWNNISPNHPRKRFVVIDDTTEVGGSAYV
ncbi:DEAD/DEAH box helicase [Geoalkalibacter halelectricus]|uniref:DEAD/DEAH box helicase n=1 Tax=Geoalkalibacter halelectricus TaxID=2847045 RepID=UPI003D1C71A4